MLYFQIQALTDFIVYSVNAYDHLTKMIFFWLGEGSSSWRGILLKLFRINVKID